MDIFTKTKANTMNKPYFVMSLPSEKKIDDWGGLVLDGEPKLFLCTKDIVVGDRVWERLTTGQWMDWKVDNINDLDIPNQLKIIGEISPNATWVKEHDTFSDDEWKNEENDGKNYDQLYKLMKCPTCNSFH